MLSAKYVGIDMGSGYIKLSYQGKVYETETPKEAINNGVISNVSQIAETIKVMVLENKLSGKQAVIVYNGPSVFTKVVKLPVMKDEEIQDYLDLEAENIVPFPVNDGVVDFLVLKKDMNSMEILTIAIKNDLVVPYIDVIKKVGLIPIAIDIPALAIGRMIFPKKEEGLQLIIDVGTTTTDIHIYQDSIFRFSRSINIGGDDFDNILSASLGIDRKQALRDRITNSYEPMIFRGIFMDLQRELVRSIDYFRYRYGNQEIRNFTKVHILGGNNGMFEFKEIIKEVTGIAPDIIQNSRNLMVKGLVNWRVNK